MCWVCLIEMHSYNDRVSENHKKVLEMLTIEADAVRSAAERISSSSVDAAIELFNNCTGKVLVIGVGKSGVIAQKIAQTMTSTGTIAVFVHPSDALHGSLGVAAVGDVVLALSNSGETDEILALLPTIKKRDIPLVSIVGNLSSTLAAESDVVLDASVDKEACPLNLAPTTSTTVALSIGDALAMTMMQNRGLTPEQFAENHPAGRLGKRLTISVADLMGPSPEVGPESSLMEVVKTLSKYGLGAVNVVNQERVLVGLITDGDLRRSLESPDFDVASLTADSLMTRSPITIERETLAFEAMKLMEERSSQISVLPVVDSTQKPVGLIRIHDIVRAGI